ncbi:MAG: polysaccharide deacetylase family protein [Actinobacteria bacterium]|nr:MAG: polysaccharide deacetylase family protein [Actinomycetota bacterium]
MRSTSRYLLAKWLIAAVAVVLAVLVLRPYVLANPDRAMRLVELTLKFGVLPLSLLAGLITYYEYRGLGPQEGIVRRGRPEHAVALTFDDGPSPVYTAQILDVLNEKGAKATFFVVGEHVRKYPDLARRIVAEGHDIGNHTMNHRDLIPAGRQVVIDEIECCGATIEQVTGVAPVLFRPPRGIYGNAIRQLVVDMGYRMILWTLSTIDWRGKRPSSILRRVRARIRPGGIILFHDSGALIKCEGGSRENTVQAVGLVIDYLKDVRGYELVTVSEMLRRLDAEGRPSVGDAKDRPSVGDTEGRPTMGPAALKEA